MRYNYLVVFLIAILSLWSDESKCQSLRLLPENPLPRINQEIELKYFYSNTEVENRFESYIENSGANNLLSGTVKINDSITANSKIVIGPFEVRFNGKNIKSDSLIIRVFDKLPDTNQGVWINQVIVDGSVFIIIEQRIPTSKRGGVFVGFNRPMFLQNDVEPYEFSAQTSSSQATGYTERRTVLLIKELHNLKSDLNINQTFFTDLPKSHPPINLVLKK